ncbi:MAG: dehalogenase [Chloroflexi bacterium]|nr:MAG: dehalogenase [Chloroflexota bacterium]
MTWLILGLLFGAVFFWLATRPNFKLRWYEWILAVLGVILILFAIQNYQASIVELEPRAASILLWMFGLPGLILAVVAGVLAWMRNRKAA